MKYLIWACLPLLILCSRGLHAQHELAEDLLMAENRGEVYFSFDAGLQSPDLLPAWVSIDRVDDKGNAYAYARLEKLVFWPDISMLPGIKILTHPGLRTNPGMKSNLSIEGLQDWDFYPTYESYLSLMAQFQESFPGLCRIENIGQSAEGRDLLVAVISDNVLEDEGEAQFLYSSSMHGDETAGYVLFLRLIDYLLNHYATDEQVKNLVDNLEIWINPLANPDGTYAGGNSTVFGATRFNANGVDINRNFPDPEDGDHPDGNAWQPETLAFMELAEENNFVMAANCHGGNEVFNYPWDTWPKLHADDDWWYLLGREWADTVHAYSPPGYFDGFDNGVTNGYQWYSISGGRQDYMNYFHHCREFTLEISNVKLLPASALDDFWEYNYRSFLNYMKQSLYGIRGRIEEAGTGSPLVASVVIENHDLDGSWVVSNPQGWYYRPVIAGNYSIQFFRPGYELLTVDNVSAVNFEETVLHVELTPTNSGTSASMRSHPYRLAGSPGKGLYTLTWLDEAAVVADLQVVDMNGRGVVATKNARLTPEGNLTIDLRDQPSGIYLLQISWNQETRMLKLIKY